MKELINIKDDLNVGKLERELQAVLDLVCDRMTADEEAEETFERFNRRDLASHTREFQDFNYIVSSTLKMLVDEIHYTIEEINKSIEKALSEQRPNSTDNA